MVDLRDAQILSIVKEVMTGGRNVIVPSNCTLEDLERMFSAMGVKYLPVYTGLDLNEMLEQIENKLSNEKWYALMDYASSYEKEEVKVVNKIVEVCRDKDITVVHIAE